MSDKPVVLMDVVLTDDQLRSYATLAEVFATKDYLAVIPAMVDELLKHRAAAKLKGAPIGQLYDFLESWRQAQRVAKELTETDFVVNPGLRTLNLDVIARYRIQADALGETLDAMEREARP